MKKINLLLLFLLLACALPAQDGISVFKASVIVPSLSAELTATHLWNSLITESAYAWNIIFQTIP